MKHFLTIILSALLAFVCIFPTATKADDGIVYPSIEYDADYFAGGISNEISMLDRTSDHSVSKIAKPAESKTLVWGGEIGSISVIQTKNSDAEAQYKLIDYRGDYPLPDHFDEYDVAKLRSFLEIEDANGVKNGEKINGFSDIPYDPDDPATWANIIWTSEEAGNGTEPGHVWVIQYWSYNFTEYVDFDPYFGREVPANPDDLLVGTLDISGMQEIIDVNIPYNLIDGVIADDCPRLQMYYCGESGFYVGSTLDNATVSEVSARNCPSLTYIGAPYGIQSSIDIAGCTSIMEIFMDTTPNLTSITLDECKETLECLSCCYSGVTSLDISDMNSLMIVHADDSPISSIDVHNNNSSFELSVANCPLSELDLSECPNIYALYIPGTNITELDFSECTGFEALECTGLALTTLDLTASDAFYFLMAAEMPNLREIRVNAHGHVLTILSENCSVGMYMGLYNFGGTEVINPVCYPTYAESEFSGWFDANGTLVSDSALGFSFDESWFATISNMDVTLTAKWTNGPTAGVIGDADGNGIVEAADAVLVARHVMDLIELDEATCSLCDIDGNGIIQMSDATSVLRIALGFID